MPLRSLFEKPVDRPINGVIKADDDASLRLEIEEYVLTKEVEKRLESFLGAYNAYEGANGVWISGFFGSGKSHLLKLLAVLLENRSVAGEPALAWFLPKCGENEFLKGELKRAAALPSKSVLFNIDQKADVISKTEFDALLSVFVKVFNEMRGYYGKQGHIARFERDLDSRSLYDQFKTEYQAIAGQPWERGREQALLESRNIARAYAAATDNPEDVAQGILDKYRQDYRVSIEDFAEEVSAYIDQQSPQFRLNFLVDEVGQYIAGHVKLMTNLQTIAESLATKCQGRAWILVTAQEDMNDVIGEMGRQQSHDFSKIQDRFANRMKLTGQDVAEVIQRRLLAKRTDQKGQLSGLYRSQANNFRTLLDFADGSIAYRNFQDQGHFINCYPFIPYQFTLFQSAIQQLSQHDAFEGKHRSVGERSMLAVFQTVAVTLQDREVGQLATFDLMFEGIRFVVKSNIQSAVLMSEKQLENALAVKLLKALFLVKYVKEFKATARNLAILMLERFDQDLAQHHQAVQEALNLLEQQSYIQRNGNLYEYLTDDEKDIEQEIKNTEVDGSAVAEELEKLIFEQTIKNRKIRHSNGQDYPYSHKLDDRLYGREHELTIHVISPFNEQIDNPQTLLMQSMGRDELLAIMPANDGLIRDLLMYKRVDKYIAQNISLARQDNVRRILTDKGLQNKERYRDLQERVKGLLGKAKFYIAGAEYEIGGEDAQNRMVLAFHELITKVYPNLRMLPDKPYKEEEIGQFLRYAQEPLISADGVALSEAEQELLGAIQGNQRQGVRTTLKSLIDKFERKPYGWSYAAVLCVLAKLCGKGKVEARSDGNLLESEALEAALGNSRNYGHVILDPQADFTASQTRALKDFYAEFFERPPMETEAKALGRETGRAFSDLKNEMGALAPEVASYPFATRWQSALEALADFCGKSYAWYLTDLAQREDSLFELKEVVIDPIRRFMRGEQRKIYDEARDFTQTQALNFAYLDHGAAAEIRDILADPLCFQGNQTQRLKTQTDSLRGAVAQRLEREINQVKERVALWRERLGQTEGFTALSEAAREEIDQALSRFETEIARQTVVDVIQNRAKRFEEQDYPRLLAQLLDVGKPSTLANPQPDVGDPSSGGGTPAADPQGQYVVYRSVQVTFAKAWLTDEADVDDYLRATREALLAEIRQGKRIQV
ncbi:MAG: BREX system P-loop protein BrxC [Cyanobacteriota bacterium]|jgi:hypothetical protein